MVIIPLTSSTEPNAELDKFSKWCLANRPAINTTKTFYMLFTNTTAKYQPLSRLTILNDNKYIKKKFLV